MARKVRLGMLTPSSNTVLEPVTSAMLIGLPDVTAHFGRFRVTDIALSDRSLAQFDDSEILRAADLLATAKVDVIAWNGTAASWLGFDRDERLAERITAATGINAVTCMLGFRDQFRKNAVRRVGLVTPYTSDIQLRIKQNFASSGFPVVSERHLGISDNFSFAEIDEAAIADMVRAVAREGADTIAIVCTNMRGAARAAALEKELELPVWDSVAVTLATSLEIAGVDPARLRGWGSVFDRAAALGIEAGEVTSPLH